MHFLFQKIENVQPDDLKMIFNALMKSGDKKLANNIQVSAIFCNSTYVHAFLAHDEVRPRAYSFSRRITK